MALRNQLDEIDLHILDIITKNARIPFKDVATECDISRAAVHQRVNRMIDKGSLYHEVADHLSQINEIVECHYTTGQYAIFIKVYARDNEHLKEILSEKIQKIPGISSTETFISLEETFKREVPIY